VTTGVRFALQRGIGVEPSISTTCKELLADNGYTWTDRHDKILIEDLKQKIEAMQHELKILIVQKVNLLSQPKE